VRQHRFRPRFRGVAWSAIGLGAALGVGGLVLGVSGSALIAIVVACAAGLGLGAAYLASPAWRLTVLVDDEALEVTAGGERRFRLPWREVVRVIASPSTRTCFVDGGTPERSLLVPGDGASAPYDLEDKTALYDAILAHVPATIVREVTLLETARSELAASEPEPGATPHAPTP
jgi:hypothetical protein